MIAPAARMLFLALYTGERLRKLRFLMTAHTRPGACPTE